MLHERWESKALHANFFVTRGLENPPESVVCCGLNGKPPDEASGLQIYRAVGRVPPPGERNAE